VTGALVPPRDGRALAEAINRYVEDGRDLQRRHGTAARIRVLHEFKQESIWEAIYREYLEVLEEKGLTAGIPRDAVEESGKT
jgi:glycosyltransferase involved in cell wall biosynthesis